MKTLSSVEFDRWVYEQGGEEISDFHKRFDNSGRSPRY